MDLATSPVEIAAQHEPVDLKSGENDRFPRCVDYGRSRSLAWADGVENGRDFLDAVKIPPVCAILHRDILEKGWGWERVVPYKPGDVEWPEFKEYLVAFLDKTDKSKTLLATWKPDPVGQSVKVAADALTAAIDVCLETEQELLFNFVEDFSLEDIFLSKQIRERATQLSSSGCVSSAAAAALLCITKEDELMCELLSRRFEVSETVKFCNMIRRSASNLMLCKGSGSDVDAAAVAMLGIVKEAAWILHVLQTEYPETCYECLVSEKIRRQTATVLTKLEQELDCQTSGTEGDDTRKGVTAAGDLNCKGSGSTANSKKDMNKDSEMNRNAKGDKTTSNKSSDNKAVNIKKLIKREKSLPSLV